jgi:hypothetical protein
MNTPLFCINCKHYSNRNCSHPSLNLDLVTGKHKTEYASMMRLDSYPCKPAGLLFEQVEAVTYDLSMLDVEVKL